MIPKYFVWRWTNPRMRWRLIDVFTKQEDAEAKRDRLDPTERDRLENQQRRRPRWRPPRPCITLGEVPAFPTLSLPGEPDRPRYVGRTMKPKAEPAQSNGHSHSDQPPLRQPARTSRGAARGGGRL